MSSVNESTKKDLRTEHFKPLELNVSKHFWPTVRWILILTCVLCKRELNMFKWTNNWLTQAQYTDYTRELLRNDHGDPDGNKNGQKAIIKFRLTKHLCTCMALFLNISLTFLPDCDVKLLNFTSCGGREHKTTTAFYWTSILSFRSQSQKNLPTFDELNAKE